MRSPVLAAFKQDTTAQLLCDSDGRILEANPALASWFDVDQKTLCNWHLDQIAPSLTPHYLAKLPPTESVITEVIRADSNLRVQVDMHRFKLNAGRFGYRLSFIRLESQGPLHHRLNALFESNLDGIAYSTLDGTFLFVNQAFLDLLGCEEHQVVGHSYREFTPTDYLEQEDRLLRRQLPVEGVSDVYEKHFIRRDGSVVPVSIRLALVRDEAGKPEGIWSVSRDSSLRNQLIESLTSSERRFRALFRNSLDAIGFWTMDHELRYANRAYLDMTGYSRAELARLNYTHLTPPGWEEVDDEIMQQVMERGYSDVFEKEIKHRDGSLIPISIRASAFRDNQGTITGSWVIIRDIRHYKTALNQLEHSQNLLQLTNRMARVGGWEFDPHSRSFSFTEETYRILAIPRSFDTSLNSIPKLFDEASQHRLRKEVTQTYNIGSPTDFEVMLDGFEPPRWLRVSAQKASDSSDRPYIVGAVQDISEFKARQRILEIDRDAFQQMAFHDPLTELPNRLLLEDRFQQLTFAAERSGGFVSVLVIDLDDFKDINDQRGHPAGDALLKSIANRLRQSVRQSDTVARIGGDEFIVLAAVDSADEATIIAKKLFVEMQRPVDWEGGTLQSQCSMGVAVYPVQGKSFDDLYEAADKAMYQAKAHGKNQFRAFDLST